MYSLQLVHLTTVKSIKNGSYWFDVGFTQKFCIYKLNDTNGSQG